MEKKVKVFIIYSNFFNINFDEFSIGGVQTYIYYLCKMLSNRNFEPIVFQKSTKNFNIIKSDIQIFGFKVPNNSKARIYLYKQVLNFFDKKSDIIIFGSENFSVKTSIKKTIVIQHGVYWDLPNAYLKVNKIINQLPSSFKRKYIFWKVLQNFRNSKNKVCVDYNYLNWYRTQRDTSTDERIWVIPNFTQIEPNFSVNDIKKKQRDSETIRILYARRFFRIRGLHLMIEVTRELLKSFSNILITFAGEGPDALLLDEFKNNKHVNVIKYEQKDAFKIHREHHIAIVPSLGSEGTSISVAEAMAAGCAVIATNVGGITNMILDNYNGCLINPNKTEMFEKIKRLISDQEKREEMSINGYNVAMKSFNLEKWMDSWHNVIKVICEE